MPNLTAEINIDALYSLFKGEPGTRKSTCALSYPGPQYWFSWDRKMRSLLLPMRAWGIDPKNISYDDYEDWSKPRQKLEQLQVNCPYKTLVFDSITSMADATLNQTMALKRGATRKSGANAGKLIAGIAVNELEDYNAESSALSELISLTKDIHTFHKVNIILIAHVIQVDYKSVGGETHVSRSIVTAGKKIAGKIPAYCEEVYHFNIKKSVDSSQGGGYTLLTQHTGDDFARTSLPLPKVIEFGDKPLYNEWILPGFQELRDSLTP
jgi:hypothetical protein